MRSATPSASGSDVVCFLAVPSQRPGGKIINGNLRMYVLEEMTPQLWTWLLNLGWRKSAFKYERRKVGGDFRASSSGRLIVWTTARPTACSNGCGTKVLSDC